MSKRRLYLIMSQVAPLSPPSLKTSSLAVFLMSVDGVSSPLDLGVIINSSFSHALYMHLQSGQLYLKMFSEPDWFLPPPLLPPWSHQVCSHLGCYNSFLSDLLLSCFLEPSFSSAVTLHYSSQTLVGTSPCMHSRNASSGVRHHCIVLLPFSCSPCLSYDFLPGSALATVTLLSQE